ncbi:hypothetical protein [uncultured Microscilla sp.]|uniref:hypothetical protein n=1 Tax=uncultured Microscilla sp. TaxID=432653 RepID=UPI00261D3970|nr:hypothetical protein [uncultured Microscilla sp.]
MGKKLENLGRLSFAGTFALLLFAIIILLLFISVPQANKEIITATIPRLIELESLMIAFFFARNTAQPPTKPPDVASTPKLK